MLLPMLIYITNLARVQEYLWDRPGLTFEIRPISVEFSQKTDSMGCDFFYVPKFHH
jgi:hypothetical protein